MKEVKLISPENRLMVAGTLLRLMLAWAHGRGTVLENPGDGTMKFPPFALGTVWLVLVCVAYVTEVPLLWSGGPQT